MHNAMRHQPQAQKPNLQIASLLSATYNKSRLEFLWLSLLPKLLLDGGGKGGRVASGLLRISKAAIALQPPWLQQLQTLMALHGCKQ